MKTKIANRFFLFLVIICVFMLVFLAYSKFIAPEAAEKETARRTPVVRAIESVMPAVVNLHSGHLTPEKGSQAFAGSGSLIDPSGLILTNLHVVERMPEINVTLSTGAVYQAKMIAADPENDIALLKLEHPPVILPVIPLMRPWRLMLGETVIAVGNPYGLDGTITVGILSGINRSLADGQRLLFSDLLQTDAAVFPGNSGGPLINLDGCMIGMNMAVKRNAPGISFAMPLYRIENVLAKYLIPERMLNLNLGFVPEVDLAGTILVSEVFPGSPAEKAGIRKGMVIRSFQGWNPQHDLLELSRKMIRLKPEKTVKMRLHPLGNVALIPRNFTEQESGSIISWKLGIRTEDLDPQTAEALRYPFRSGVIVSGYSDTAYQGFRRGDIIVEWNGKKINSIHDLSSELKHAAPGTSAETVVYSLMEDRENGRYLGKRSFRVFLR